MSEDLIRRSDAIGAISNHCENECYYRTDNWCPQCQREEFEEAIKAVPSADKPQGEWVKRFGSINCSVCKHSNWSDSFEDLLRRFNYCPNCGARMKGADDGRTSD